MADSLLKKFEGGLSYNEIRSFTAKARSWYMDELKDIKVPSRKLFNDPEARGRGRLLPGRLFMFFYDPKYKDTLPYYDRFPLVMVVDKAPGAGFYGLNFHYLDYRRRAILMERLLQYKNNNAFDQSTRLRLSYDMLKKASKLRTFKPCFKHYLPGQVRSQVREIPAEYWETVLFFPSEQFKKASKQSVFADSRKVI